MFRIGVFSDTHGMLAGVEKALEIAGTLDLIVHAGDLYIDAEDIAAMAGMPFRAVKAVAGNCDPPGIGPLEELILQAERKILLVHGHLFNVKFSFDRLLNKAKEESADIVIFGHTHRTKCQYYSNVLLFNPGSLSRPLYGEKPSFGVLELDEKNIIPQLYYL